MSVTPGFSLDLRVVHMPENVFFFLSTLKLFFNKWELTFQKFQAIKMFSYLFLKFILFYQFFSWFVIDDVEKQEKRAGNNYTW